LLQFVVSTFIAYFNANILQLPDELFI